MSGHERRNDAQSSAGKIAGNARRRSFVQASNQDQRQDRQRDEIPEREGFEFTRITPHTQPGTLDPERAARRRASQVW